MNCLLRDVHVYGTLSIELPPFWKPTITSIYCFPYLHVEVCETSTFLFGGPYINYTDDQQSNVECKAHVALVACVARCVKNPCGYKGKHFQFCNFPLFMFVSFYYFFTLVVATRTESFPHIMTAVGCYTVMRESSLALFEADCQHISVTQTVSLPVQWCRYSYLAVARCLCINWLSLITSTGWVRVFPFNLLNWLREQDRRYSFNV